MTLWSDWTSMINPINNGIITEKRTRFVCTIGSSSNQQLPQIKSDTVVYRMCNNQERTDCQETGTFFFFLYNFIFVRKKKFSFVFLDSLDSLHFDDWSPWSVWSGKYFNS